MKAIGMPPSDPRIRQMNDAQWLWCYMNAKQDEEEEEKMWKTRLDYIGWYIDPERAKSVMEEDERAEEDNNQRVQKEGVYNNDEFNAEAKAAELGYDPSSGLTPEEYLQQLNGKKEEKEVDIINDDFDTLLASGQFVNVTNADNSVGNSRESESDFLSRVTDMQDFANQSFDMIASDNTPIGLEEDDFIINRDDKHLLINDLLGNDREENNDINLSNYDIKNYDEQDNSNLSIKEDNIQNFDNMSPEEFKKFLEENGIDEDDLDIIETPEE